MTDTVTCSICGRIHAKEKSELVFRMPDPIFDLSKDEREKRCDIDDDFCAIDRQRLFIRGLLPIPVHGRTEPYRIGLWVEVDEATFGEICRLWEDPAQAEHPPLRGVLANDVPLVPKTFRLAVSIQLAGPKTRPAFYLVSEDHPLSGEQRRGIDAHRALEYTDSTNS